MPRIHELAAFISLNAAGFVKGVNQSLQGLGNLTGAFNRAAGDVASAATRITASVGALGGVVAKTFGGFEATMISAGAITRTLGTRDFKILYDQAKVMGETTQFTATQAASAIEKMGLAGLNTQEIITALPGALQLAASATVDIATAADVSSKTMRAFGLEASELTRINDVLVGTFTRSNTDISNLAEALKHVAPVSKALGVSLEETTAVIAKMGDAGFQGSIAGTSLRNILSRLAGAVPEATRALSKLGVQTLDASGQMLPFMDILRQIEQQALTDAQILQIFGARGGPQLLALLEVGTGAIQNFSNELVGLQGIAGDIAQAKLSGLAGAFELLKSEIEGLVIAAGEQLAPAFQQTLQAVRAFIAENKSEIVRRMTEAVRALADGFVGFVGWLRESGPALRQFADHVMWLMQRMRDLTREHPQLAAMLALLQVGKLLGITTAISSLGSAFLALVGALSGAGGATGAMAGFSKVAGLLFTPGGLIVAGTAAVLALADAYGVLGQKATEAGNNAALAAKQQEQQLDLLGKRTKDVLAATQGPGEGLAKAEALRAERDRLKQLQREQDARLIEAESRASKSADNAPLMGDWALTADQQDRQARAKMDAAFAAEQKKVADSIASLIDQVEKQLKGVESNITDDEKRRAAWNAKAAGDPFTNVAGPDPMDLPAGALAAAGAAGAAGAAAVAGGVPGAGGAGVGGGMGGGDPTDIQRAIEEARLAALDRQTPGTSELARFATMPGVTGADAAAYMSMQEGSNPALAMAFGNAVAGAGGDQEKLLQIAQQFSEMLNNINQQAESTQKATSESTQDMQQFSDQLSKLHSEGLIGGQWADQMRQKAAQLSQEYQNGTITQEQYRSRFKALQDEAERAGQVNGAVGKFEQTLKSLQQTGRLSQQQVQFFQTELHVLQQALKNGSISLDEFRRKVDELGQTARQNAGKGGGGLGPLGNMLPPWMQQVMQMGFGGGQPVMLGTPGEWFQKAAQANIKNMGGMEGGGGGGYADISAPTLANQIGVSVSRNLQALTSPSGMSTDPLFRDPGLQTVATPPGQVNIQLEAVFPDVRNLSQTQVAELANMLDSEMARRGMRTI